MALHLFLLAFVSATPGGTFAALNQGNYPDWATRWPAQELYEQDCRPLWIPNKYGPFDYRSAGQSDRELVEGAHFSQEYEAYLKGQKKSSRHANELPPAAGFGYTLWSFPNHPQALAAMEDLGIRLKTERLPGALLRVHCFFQRAVRFAPDDALVRSIYGYYYARRGKVAEANIQLEKAESLDSIGTNTSVYAAFAYIEIKDYKKALAAAKKAYSLGYSLPGLRRRLERAGVWKD
jgi:tetratricopeptide (TPR) repeat protein